MFIFGNIQNSYWINWERLEALYRKQNIGTLSFFQYQNMRHDILNKRFWIISYIHVSLPFYLLGIIIY